MDVYVFFVSLTVHSQNGSCQFEILINKFWCADLPVNRNNYKHTYINLRPRRSLSDCTLYVRSCWGIDKPPGPAAAGTVAPARTRAHSPDARQTPVLGPRQSRARPAKSSQYAFCSISRLKVAIRFGRQPPSNPPLSTSPSQITTRQQLRTRRA